MWKQHEVQKHASAREAMRAAPCTASSIENSAAILHYMDSGVLCPGSLYSASQLVSQIPSMDKERWCLVSTLVMVWMPARYLPICNCSFLKLPSYLVFSVRNQSETTSCVISQCPISSRPSPIRRGIPARAAATARFRRVVVVPRRRRRVS